jgi:hypothetical protein
MPLYDVYVYCNECLNEHPMGMIYRIELAPHKKLVSGEFTRERLYLRRLKP